MTKLSALVCGLALAAGASTMYAGSPSATLPAPRHASEILSSTTGHNLQRQRAARAAASGGLRLKTLSKTALPNVKNAKNLLTRAPQTKAPAAYTSAIWAESFELGELFAQELPDGWQTLHLAEGGSEPQEQWLNISDVYANYYMFAPPADGQMMMGIFYGETPKDEWLVSDIVEIPAEGDWHLNYYWYTVPLYLYQVDRYTVDFEANTFIERIVNYNFEVMVREAGTQEWTLLVDFEKKFSHLDYDVLADLDYATMQLEEVSLAQWLGKTVEFAFRYHGCEGNSFFLDAVSVDLPRVDVAYTPHYSRLFYGISPDEELWWLPASVELYPVGHPVTWYNDSPETRGVDFSWVYYTLGDNGTLVPQTDNSPDMLEVTYTPDYSSPEALRNNFYPQPQLYARSPQGGISSYTSPADLLQAGGTTEYDYGADDGGYVKYHALPFDIINEGFGVHFEGDEQLGFFLEPIFGKSENTDQWWMHYCFPDDYPDGNLEGKYAYVDGFANLYLPHDTAPMVVTAVSAVAMGTIDDEAEFTASIYAMDPMGAVIETPVASKTITGADLLHVPSGLTQDYLVLNFPLDAPVVFSTEGTGYGYIVDITGYHSDHVQYFAPLQSMEPNPYEWCLGFYHIKHYLHTDLTNEFSYLAFFKDDYGRDLYSSFAIGLDAHYPWLMLPEEAAQPVVISNECTSFDILGYYEADEYTVDAPDWLHVDLAGRYTTRVTAWPLEASDADRSATVTITAPGVELAVDLTVKAGTSALAAPAADADAAPVEYYDLQGRRIAAPSAPGLYLTNAGHKVLIK